VVLFADIVSSFARLAEVMANIARLKVLNVPQ
jgi:hypothetical protein